MAFQTNGSPILGRKCTGFRYFSLFLFLISIILSSGHAVAQTIIWTGNGDGISWNQAGNWSENRVPGEEDDVVINLDGTYTIEKSGNITLNSLVFSGQTGEQSLRNISGNITLQSASSLGESVTVIMQAGYFMGSGTLTNEGTIQANATAWSGINGSTLINNGLIEHISGIFYFNSGASLENNGLFDVRGDINIIQAGSAGLFINNGTLLKSASGDGFTNMTVPLDSRPGSIIESSAGLLQLQGSSIYHNMTFVADQEGPSIRMQGSTHTFRGEISGEPVGSIVLNGTSEAHEEGASLNFGGSGLTWTSSYMAGGGSFTNLGLIRLDAPSWTGVNGSTLINEGVIEQLNGIFYVTTGGSLENNGLFDVQGDINIIQAGSAGLFINAGRLLKSAGGDGSSNVTTPFESRPGSIIESSAGLLQFQGASLFHNMTFVADQEDATIRMQGSTHTFRGEISGEPVGRIVLNGTAEAYEEGASLNFGGVGLTWTSSYMAGGGTFTNLGLIRLDAPSWTGVNGSTLINEGVIEQLNGIFYVTNGGTLENNGLFDVQGDINIIQAGSAGLFVNSGQLLKSVGNDGFTTVNVPLESRPESIIESSAGLLQFQGASLYHNMTFVADQEDATIRLQSGTHTFRGEITGEPVGSVILNSRAEAHEEGATLNFGGSGLTWISSYIQDGGVMTNTGLITLNAPSWTGINNATLINEGEVIQQAGIFYLTSSGVFENNGLYRVEGGSGINPSGSAGVFKNNALLVIDVISSLFSVSTIIENSTASTIDVQNGEFRFTGNGVHLSPQFLVSENASLSFHAGLHSFSGLINTQPDGDFILRTNFRTESSQATFNVGGSGLRWESGYLTEGTVTSSGIMTIAVSGSPGVSGGTFVNSGNATFTGGNFRILADSEFRNSSIFTISDDFTIISTQQNTGIFSNNGLFQKTGGDGTSFFQSHFTNENTGELRHITGEIRFNAEFNHDADALISGTGKIDIARAVVQNKGTTAPGSPLGIFTLVGDYFPNDTTAVMDITLYEFEDTESGTMIPSSDRLKVERTSYSIGFTRPGGQAVLGGSLNIETDGNFIPETGTEFEIIRAERGITGGFSAYNGVVDQINQLSYYPQIRDTSLFLVTIDGIPSLSGDIEASPAAVQAGGQQMITFTGNGLPPDVSVALNCVECNEPEIFGTIAGRIGSINPDTAEVWFDLTDGLISGTYEAVFNDPRGGQAQTTIQINPGSLVLSVKSEEPNVDTDNVKPGKFIIQTNRPVEQTLRIQFNIVGTAQRYVDYISDNLGNSVAIQPGSDRAVINIYPTRASGSSGAKSLSFTLQSSDSFEIESGFSSITIPPSQSNDEFKIYAVTPAYGGRNGNVSTEVIGTGISENSTIKLERNGIEIHGTNVTVRESGTAIYSTFALTGAALGQWNLTVTDPGGFSQTITSGFSVREHKRPSVVANIIAPPRVARGRQNLYKLNFQNTGNSDVLGIPGLVGLPAGTSWSIVNRSTNNSEVNLEDFVTTHTSNENSETLQFWPMRIPPGVSVSLEVHLSISNTGLVRIKPAWFGN